MPAIIKEDEEGRLVLASPTLFTAGPGIAPLPTPPPPLPEPTFQEITDQILSQQFSPDPFGGMVSFPNFEGWTEQQQRQQYQGMVRFDVPVPEFPTQITMSMPSLQPILEAALPSFQPIADQLGLLGRIGEKQGTLDRKFSDARMDRLTRTLLGGFREDISSRRDDTLLLGGLLGNLLQDHARTTQGVSGEVVDQALGRTQAMLELNQRQSQAHQQMLLQTAQTQLTQRITTVTAQEESQLDGFLGSMRNLGEIMRGSHLVNYVCPPGTPGDSVAGLAQQLLGTAMVTGFSAHAAAAGIEAIPLFRAMGLQQVAGYLAELAGFRPIIENTYGVYLSEVLGWRTRYHVRELCRPRIPTEGSIFLLGRKHGITQEVYTEAMGLQGLSDFWIKTLFEFGFADPSPFVLRRMIESGIPVSVRSEIVESTIARTEDPGYQGAKRWLYGKNLLTGYDVPDSQIMTEAMWHSISGPARTQLKTSVRRFIREGYGGRGFAVEKLRPQGVIEEEIDLIVAAEELRGRINQLTEMRRLLRDQRAKGLIDEEDHREALLGLGLRRDFAELEVTRATIRTIPKPRKPVAPAEDKTLRKIITAMARGNIQLFRKRQISMGELYQRLLSLGYVAAYARATVVLEAARRLKPPKFDDPLYNALTPRELVEGLAQDYSDAFHAGRLDPDQYLAALLMEEVPLDVARYVVDQDALDVFLEEVS